MKSDGVVHEANPGTKPSCADSTLGCRAVPSRGQTTDAAKHSREITLIVESDGSCNVHDPHVGVLQVFFCHPETQIVDQRPVCESVGCQPSGQRALRGVHQLRRKSRGWVAFGEVRPEHGTKRVYIVKTLTRDGNTRSTICQDGAARRPVQAGSRYGDIACLLLRQDSAAGKVLLRNGRGDRIFNPNLMRDPVPPEKVSSG